MQVPQEAGLHCLLAPPEATAPDSVTTSQCISPANSPTLFQVTGPPSHSGPAWGPPTLTPAYLEYLVLFGISPHNLGTITWTELPGNCNWHASGVRPSFFFLTISPDSLTIGTMFVKRKYGAFRRIK